VSHAARLFPGDSALEQTRKDWTALGTSVAQIVGHVLRGFSHSLIEQGVPSLGIENKKLFSGGSALEQTRKDWTALGTSGTQYLCHVLRGWKKVAVAF